MSELNSDDLPTLGLPATKTTSGSTGQAAAASRRLWRSVGGHVRQPRTMILSVTSRPRAYCEPPTLTSSGPLNGATLSTATGVSGSRPSDERYRSRSLFSSAMQPMTASSPGSSAVERAHLLLRQGPVLPGDRVPVRAGERVAQLFGQARLDLRAEHVLELAGLLVHGVPRHVEVVDQEALAEAVAADERSALRGALLGERDGPVLTGLPHEAAGPEAGDHLATRTAGRRRARRPGE